MKNLQNIMTRAHELTRAARAEYPAADYRATFAAALRIAWEEASAPTAAGEWAAMTGDEQYNALWRMTLHCYKRDNASGEDAEGKMQRAPVFGWIKTEDDLRAVAHEAYIRVMALLDSAEDGEELRRILWKSVMRAARYIDRQERRNPSALRVKLDENGDAVTDAEGEKLLQIDTTSPTAERIAPDPYTAAAVLDSIERAAKDDKDRIIMQALAAGYSARQIADVLGMSHTVINKRIAGFRARYEDETPASAAAIDLDRKATRQNKADARRAGIA